MATSAMALYSRRAVSTPLKLAYYLFLNKTDTSVIVGIIAGSVILSALLWIMCGWAARTQLHLPWLVLTTVVVVACLGFVVYGLFFAEVGPTQPGMTMKHLLEPIVLPMFIALPFSVSLAASQFLQTRMSTRNIQLTSTLIGIVVLCGAPFGAIIAGCGLAGACF